VVKKYRGPNERLRFSNWLSQAWKISFLKAMSQSQIQSVAPSDEIFKYNVDEQKKQVNAKPWLSNPNYFKRVQMSAVALLKMSVHAQSGGDLEVMGLMLGRIEGEVMIVMDAFRLPVEGTETRVNAQAEAYEYMVQYLTQWKEMGRHENVIGWYHSHPGYGCWLSGIDVSTQQLNQQFQEPFLAVVIDPHRSLSAGKIDIGAFRTYPKDATNTTASKTKTVNASIPLEKIEDFGVHANQYYSLDVSYFKSSADDAVLQMLYNKYWMDTLASSPLMMNYEHMTKQIRDLSGKLSRMDFSSVGKVRQSFDMMDPLSDPIQALSELSGQQPQLSPSHERRMKQPIASSSPSTSKQTLELRDLCGQARKLCCETSHGLLIEVLKMHLFAGQ
jgi:COP9 signalosome complex subunit 5